MPLLKEAGRRLLLQGRHRPQLDHPLIEFIGEIGDHEKRKFLGDAAVLLFPIDWPEPFGLVMIEAMREGTPVVAWNCGSVPEVVDEGVTGFAVASIDEAVRAAELALRLDRASIRARFEERFTASRMATNYRAAYDRVLAGSHSSGRDRIERVAIEGIEVPRLAAGRSLLTSGIREPALSWAKL